MTARGHSIWITVYAVVGLLAAWMLACTDFWVFGISVAIGGFGAVANLTWLLDKLGWPA